MPPLEPDSGQLAALIDALTPLGGLSGHENAVATAIVEHLTPTAGDVWQDALGNVIARYGPGDAAHSVAVLAHMDTVGMMVKRVNVPDGLLHVVPVGGVNVKALPGTAVDVWTLDEPGAIARLPGIPGVIDVRSQHLERPGDTVASLDDLVIQVDPEAAARLRITTPVTYTPQTIRQGALYSSPHLDNRAGCAVLLALGSWLADYTGQDTAPDNHAIYLVGTVQEETTCAGALAALRTIQPDTVIVVDGTLSYDTPATRSNGAVRLGSGPVLTAFLYVSGLNGWHADPRFRAQLCAKAHAAQIPIQEDAIRGLMSDVRIAAWLGIPSVAVGIPMRGKHSPLETLHLDDLAHTTKLLSHALLDPYIPA